jgi:hypothetical protein
MNDILDTRPEVQVIADSKDVMQWQVFINGEEWSQWTTGIRISLDDNVPIANVTLDFIAKLVGDPKDIKSVEGSV